MASVYAKKPKLTSYIDSIPDAILGQIFCHLPLRDRLHLSEVCSRWHKVTHLDWLDVVDVDLTPIPSPIIGAVLRLSPHVESIFALRRFLILDDLTEHYQINVTSVKLYDVKIGLASLTGDEKYTHEYSNLVRFMRSKDEEYQPESKFSGFRFNPDISTEEKQTIDLFTSKLNQYFEGLPQLEELVLHNLSVTDLSQLPAMAIIPISIQTTQLNTLSRLQLSGSRTRKMVYAHLLSESLRKLPQLKCLLLHLSLLITPPDLREIAEFCDAVASMKNLRELSLHTNFTHCGTVFRRCKSSCEIALQLPRLEVLFLVNGYCDEEQFVSLYTTHPTLRVLLISGCLSNSSNVVPVPVRKFRLNATSEPLSFLHVFFGYHYCTCKFDFSDPTWARIIRFDEVSQEFLANDEVAEILNGVWVAEMFKDTASYDPNLFE